MDIPRGIGRYDHHQGNHHRRTRNASPGHLCRPKTPSCAVSRPHREPRSGLCTAPTGVERRLGDGNAGGSTAGKASDSGILLSTSRAPGTMPNSMSDRSVRLWMAGPILSPRGASGRENDRLSAPPAPAPGPRCWAQNSICFGFRRCLPDGKRVLPSLALSGVMSHPATITDSDRADRGATACIHFACRSWPASHVSMRRTIAGCTCRAFTRPIRSTCPQCGHRQTWRSLTSSGSATPSATERSTSGEFVFSWTH